MTSSSSSSSSPNGLLVSDVVQKAFVEVNEEGTEAAAATGVGFRMASFEEPIMFHCDRPFAFFIKEEESGVTLFSGRMAEATEE